MAQPAQGMSAFDRRQVRLTIVAFGMAAFVVVLAAIAWACVPWKGEMTVDDTSNTNPSVTVYGENLGGMTWCPGTSYSPVVVSSGNVDVSVAPNDSAGDPCAGASNHLDGPATYDVTIVEAGFVDYGADGFDTDGPGSLDRVADCMPTSSAPVIHELGTMSVDADGEGGPTSYQLPPTFLGSNSATPSEAAGICVTAENNPNVSNQGNMLPLTIDSGSAVQL